MLFKFKAISRFLFAIVLIIVLLFAGSFGFMILEGYDFLDAFYMTVITISTVGFGVLEGGEFTAGGKIFVIFLILTSIGTFAYGISAITSYFVAGVYAEQYKSLKTIKKINRMNNHIIVCGFGRVGQKVCEDLKSHGKEFLVIESSETKANLITDTYNYLSIHGDATNEEVLKRGHIEKAKVLITTLPNDADNVYTVLTALEMNSDLTIISRASQKSSVNKLRRAGANNVIMPDRVGGSHMASLVSNPDIMEFLDHISIQGAAEVNLEEVCMNDSSNEISLSKLRETCRNNNIAINIVGFKTDKGQIVINPESDLIISPRTKLFIIGVRSKIEEFNSLVGADFL